MEIEDPKCGSSPVSEDRDVEICAEEIIKLIIENEDEKNRTSGSAESTKGVGLKKWKRIPRRGGQPHHHHHSNQGKEVENVQDPNKSPTLKRELHCDLTGSQNQVSRHHHKDGSNLVPNVAGNVGLIPIQLMMDSKGVRLQKENDRTSDSGSVNAMGNAFAFGGLHPSELSDDQSSKSSIGTSYPRAAPEALVRSLTPDQLGKEKEEYKPSFMIDLGSRDSLIEGLKHGFLGGSEEKNLVASSKKARSVKTRKKSSGAEDSGHEDSGTSTGRAVFERALSPNHSENVSTSSVSYWDKPNMDDNGDSALSTGNNNLSDSASNDKVSGRRMTFGASNGGIFNREDNLSSNHMHFEIGTSEREKSQEPWVPSSNGENGDSAIRILDFSLDNGSPSEESFASGASGKEKEDAGISRNVSVNSDNSVCLDHALSLLRTAEEALCKEHVTMKDLSDGIDVELLHKMNFNNVNELEQDEIDAMDNNGVHEVDNHSLSEEESDVKNDSWQTELEKINDTVTVLKGEIETINEDTFSEYMRAASLAMKQQKGDISKTAVEKPVDATASELRLLQNRCQETESILEEEYRSRLQAELETLLWKAAAEDAFSFMNSELSILQEHKNLKVEQLQTALQVKDTEVRLLNMKDQAADLDNAQTNLSQKDDSFSLWNRTKGYGLLSFVQLILLYIVVSMFLQSADEKPDIVPT